MSDAAEEVVGEPGCQLYLIGPPDLREGFAASLEAALFEGGSAAFLLRAGAEMAQEWRKNATVPPQICVTLQRICADCAVAFLIEDEVELALAIGADGVHLSDPGAAAAVRARLGPERILGASCGTSRHAAMLAGEAGADYIAFGEPDRAPGAQLLELIAWWNELFVLPCLAEGAPGMGGYAPLARAGADFIGVRDAVWRHPDGAAAGVRSIRDAIAGS